MERLGSGFYNTASVFEHLGENWRRHNEFISGLFQRSFVLTYQAVIRIFASV